MIKAIVVQLAIGGRHEHPPTRAFPNVPYNHIENMVIIKTGVESTVGFLRVEDAITVRDLLARHNPGNLYALFEIKDVAQCPPGDIQRKRLNDVGELINVE